MRKVHVVLLVVLLPLALAAYLFSASPIELGPPPPAKVEPITDTIHDTVLIDPYRWLENGDAPEVQAWTEAQNAYYQKYVDNFNGKEQIRAQLDKLYNTGAVSEPTVRGNRYFIQRRTGQQNHMVLYLREGLTGSDQVLLDPNTFSADGTAALDWFYISQDGSRMAYGVSQAGTEWSTLYVMDIPSRQLHADTIPRTRGCTVAWLTDNSGFYYTRYPMPGTVAEGDDNYYRKVYFHRLGTQWENDLLIWENTADKTTWCGPDLSPDGRWLLISDYYGWSKSELFLKDTRDPNAPFVHLTDGREAMYQTMLLNDRFIIQTNDGAPMGKVLLGRYEQPLMADWKEIIPEREVTFKSVAVLAHHIVINAVKNATSQLELYTLDGQFVKEVALPSIGSVEGVSGEWNGSELFYQFNSFTVPTTIYHYEFAAGESSLFEEITTPFDLSKFEVKQVWYTSKDGTQVSMFIIAPRGITLNGQTPCLLDGYGGFNSMEMPAFYRKRIPWLLAGNVYAIPNLRGGAEYGEKWHRAGMLESKQNTFNDFIAAAEYLIDEGYTSPEKLALYGGSNGGLLIGAILTQRPDLFAAAVCDVPLLDMIRYHKFRIARLWIPEYGSSEDPAQFEYILKYSPYHNVKPGTAYPAVLFKAGESDSRVDPLHARKMAALIQASTSSDSPILLRIEGKAGHGQGKPVAKRVEELVEEWSFVFKALGLHLQS